MCAIIKAQGRLVAFFEGEQLACWVVVENAHTCL
jgi:hypothetical protein